MLNKRQLCTAVLAALTLSATGLAQAQDVHLARNANAADQAVAAMIATDIYKRAGFKAVVQPMPAARATAADLAGEVDGEVGRIQAYADKNTSLLKVDPAYYFLTTTAFVKDGKGIKITSKDDLKKYKVGIIRGVAHTTVATAGHPALEVVGDADQLYKMLEAGRIDVALDSGVNGPFMVKKLGLSGIVEAGTVARLDLFLILNPAKKDLEAKLAGVVSGLKASGELDKMARKYEQDFIASGASN
jgi:polar amino acid transport system substrate-binding protein